VESIDIDQHDGELRAGIDPFLNAAFNPVPTAQTG
jgi:hypothetical protein